MDQVFADPQVAHLGMSKPIAHPRLGEISVVGQPVILSRTSLGDLEPAPDTGEHNHDVLATMLGLDRARIDELARQGVI
ncbi:formyl-coenzyme A transferase [compost metagenome]